MELNIARLLLFRVGRFWLFYSGVFDTRLFHQTCEESELSLGRDFGFYADVSASLEAAIIETSEPTFGLRWD